LLGKLIERLSGLRYRDYVTTNILQPLGMRSAVWAPSVAATQIRRDVLAVSDCFAVERSPLHREALDSSFSDADQ
jgi:CubicO group peptidase (beta-lactamase class C family)